MAFQQIKEPTSIHQHLNIDGASNSLESIAAHETEDLSSRLLEDCDAILHKKQVLSEINSISQRCNNAQANKAPLAPKRLSVCQAENKAVLL